MQCAESDALIDKLGADDDGKRQAHRSIAAAIAARAANGVAQANAKLASAQAVVSRPKQYSGA